MAWILQLYRRYGSSILTGVLFVTTTLMTLACSKIEEENYPDKIPERPAMLFSDTTLLDFYEGPNLSWKLKTAWLERWGGDGKIFAKPILVDIFDSLGYKVAFLRSDSGELDSRMSYVKAYGHVYALTPKGASVRADSLLWDKHENNVHTDSYVRVVSEDGDVLQGKGFVSDARLENWQIKANVTGIFQDAADRIKNEDEKARLKMSADSSAGISSSSMQVGLKKQVSSSSVNLSSSSRRGSPFGPNGFRRPLIPLRKRSGLQRPI